MPINLERAINIALGVAAVSIAASVVHREFSPRPVSAASARTPTEVKNWQEALPAGVRYGKSSVPVTIVELSDLECQFCARFDAMVDSVLTERRDDVALIYLHFPLPGHRFARPAARAAECADREGRFRELASAIFAKQDSLGFKSFTSFAHDAGIRDTLAFERCLTESLAPPRIAAGEAFGHKIGIRGTPSILINGWKIDPPQSREQMLHIIDSVKTGEARRED